MNLKQQILSAKDAELQAHEVPEWNATVYIRSFNGSERAKIVGSYKEGDMVAGYHTLAQMVVAGLADEQGNRIFTDADINDLMRKNGKVIERLAGVIGKFNGLHAGANEAEKKD